MVTDILFMNHFKGAAQLLVARFRDGGIFRHWHDVVGIANDMQNRNACFRQRREVIDRIPLIGHCLTLRHFILLEAVFPVVRTADSIALPSRPALEIHHRRIRIDGCDFFRIRRRPIIDDQAAPRHAFQHRAVGEKVLKTQIIIKCIPALNRSWAT